MKERLLDLAGKGASRTGEDTIEGYAAPTVRNCQKPTARMGAGVPSSAPQMSYAPLVAGLWLVTTTGFRGALHGPYFRWLGRRVIEA
jgi:hypothetical protein